jgi:hypothetical protein
MLLHGARGENGPQLMFSGERCETRLNLAGSFCDGSGGQQRRVRLIATRPFARNTRGKSGLLYVLVRTVELLRMEWCGCDTGTARKWI